MLDNTLEEELADKIRQQSLELKEGDIQNTNINYALEKSHVDYLQLLDIKIQHQLQNTLVFVKEIGEANLPESINKDVQIVDKLLTNIISSIKKAVMDEDHIRQELLEIDYEENKSAQINVRRMIIYLVQAIPLVYKAKYITINKKIDNDIPNHIYGNNEALKKILLNLITNAVKYSDGGNVDISVEKFSDASEKLLLKFLITDTGIGMKKEVVDFLEDENTSNIGKYPGLAVVKHLVSKNSMSLLVKTNLGVGTKIEFQMPYKTEKQVTA